jgi:acetyl-CoA C-acetyltransferase
LPSLVHNLANIFKEEIEISNPRDVVILSAVRSPFAKFGGDFKNIKAVELGGMVIKEALRRASITGEDVDEAIMGQVVPTGSGQVPGRQAAVKGGIPYRVPSFTINKVCGSSMKAVTPGAQAIKAGDANVVVCGGMENKSNVPYISRQTRWGARMNNFTFEDGMVV